MKTILSVVGTRPEAIKMAPVILTLNSDSRFASKFCSTGQHTEMLESAISYFGLRADISLNVISAGPALHDIAAAILKDLGPVIDAVKPDWMLVQGDTTTTAAASLAAFYKGIPIAHIEAGLRSGRIFEPWPEEGNRKLVAAIADLHFAPTEASRSNLLREGISDDCIFITGNTCIDALHIARAQLSNNPQASEALIGSYSWLQSKSRLVLITAHRRENFGARLENIFRALKRIALKFPECQFLYFLHLNPNARDPAFRALSGIKNIHLCEPVDYLSLLYLMERCVLIITDSGGIQEEAPSFGKPVLVLREVTERPEAIEAGTAHLVGTDVDEIVKKTSSFLAAPPANAGTSDFTNPFGDGNAAGRIVEILAEKEALPGPPVLQWGP
jgi:UDP-N-acetylglucosamine 2-epimerase (non-hydrolysing)